MRVPLYSTPDLSDVLADDRWQLPVPATLASPCTGKHWEALGPLQTGCKKARQKKDFSVVVPSESSISKQNVTMH